MVEIKSHPKPTYSPLALRSTSGVTLVENLIAMAVVVTLLGALFAIGAHCLKVTNSGREAALASQALSDRMDALRNCTWSQVTSSSYVQTSVMNTTTSAAANLNLPTETVTINTYPTALSPGNVIVRTGTTTTVSTTNSAIANGNLARVDISLSWTGNGGRARTVATATLVARSNP